MLRTWGLCPAAGELGRRARLAAVLLSVLAAGISGCGRDQATEASQVEAVRLTVVPWPGSAAFFVAREKGYFLEQGLDATLVYLPSGHLALDAVLSGKVDFAQAGDTPIAARVMAGRPVSVVATVAEIEQPIRIVARGDRGIAGPASLPGHSLGITLGTTAEFFLHIYLATSGVNPADIRLVNLPVTEMVEAVVSGKVDAACTWSPHSIEMKNRLGKNAVVMTDSTLYRMSWNLAVTRDFASARPKTLEKVLRAVIRANRFILENPEETLAICTRVSGVDFSLFREEWKDYSFRVSLDQSLVLNLEDQARWMSGARGQAGTCLPDFLECIRPEALEAVRPEAVRIPGR